MLKISDNLFLNRFLVSGNREKIHIDYSILYIYI